MANTPRHAATIISFDPNHHAGVAPKRLHAGTRTDSDTAAERQASADRALMQALVLKLHTVARVCPSFLQLVEEMVERVLHQLARP